MTETALQVERLGKRYRIGGAGSPGHGSLRESLTGTVRRPIDAIRHGGAGGTETLWALDDVTFEVGWGEAVGIIGSNGAGKSTLLKILSRVTYPTKGRARLYGRVGSLLEVGTGFHSELTGRENIFLNGAILGMGRREIEAKFDEIVEFAGVERFLETPVKRYSSGMYMRLAFAVAAHLEPDILVVDEVLAVGDAAFQKRCLARMDAVARAGRTVLFVSHSMSTVEALCDRAIWLQRGRVVAEGSPAGVVQRYLEASATAQAAPLEERQDRSGDGTARLVSLAVESADGQGIIRPGSRLRISVGYRSQRPLRNAQFVLAVYDHLDAGLFLLHSDFTTPLPETLPPEGVVVCETEPIGVTAGRCVLHAELLQGNVRSDKVPRAAEFEIQDVDVFGSGMVPPRGLVRYVVGHRWTVEPAGDGRGV